jgi:two-component system response regulator ChvI
MDRSRREARVGGEPVELTATEFELLWTLASRPGHVFDRDGLIDRVYGGGVVVSDRTVDTFVKRLRRKLAAADPAFQPIETVRAVGYRFVGGPAGC